MHPMFIILDDSEDLKNLMKSYIELSLHSSCAAYGSFLELEDHRIEALSSSAAILDLELGYNQPNGLDAYRWLKANDYHGRIFFLTGHGKSHPLVQEAKKLGAEIWEKPMSGPKMVSELRNTIQTESRFSFNKPEERPRL